MALTVEEEYFIDILRMFIKQEPLAVRKACDWKKLKEISDRQQMSPIVYHMVKGYEEQAEIFSSSYFSQISDYANRNKIVTKIYDVLDDVQFVCVKGFAVAQFYPVPAMRSMGDVDLLIKKGDAIRVDELLKSNGFNVDNIGSTDVVYSYSKYKIEVHTNLLHLGLGKGKYFDFFDRVWEYINAGQLDINFHFVYLIMHMRYHLISRGIGFRFFTDIAVICLYSDLNWTWVTEVLRSLGLDNFFNTIVSLVEDWFDINIPVEHPELTGEKMEKFTHKVLADGVFGYDGDESDYDYNVSTAINRNLKYSRAVLLNKFRAVFPDQKTMESSKQYSYVTNKKCLLPIAWIHRIMNKASNDISRKKAKEILCKRATESADRLAMLKDWGV